jgi:hypothetical protein
VIRGSESLPGNVDEEWGFSCEAWVIPFERDWEEEECLMERRA